MAIIQTIRDKYAKVAGGVIVVALIGFVMMDYGKTGGGGSTTAGSINGEKIDIEVFQARVAEQEQQMKQQNPNMQADESQSAQLRDQVWNAMVAEKVMGDVDEKLGLKVTQDELRDMFAGPYPDQQVVQAFSNRETGQFDAAAAGTQFKQLESSKKPEEMQQWRAFKGQLLKTRLQQKLVDVIAGSIYVPKAILDMQHADRNTVASIDYVMLPYSLISDDKVKVTDEEVKKFMDERKKLFVAKNDSRSIDFVTFDQKPSRADSAAIMVAMDSLKVGLAASTEPEAYAARYSEQQIPAQFFGKDVLMQLPGGELLADAPTGAVVGPFLQGADYMIGKVLAKESIPDSVSVRHILVNETSQGQPVRTEAQAKARIDSVIAMLKGGQNFDSLAANFSDDPGSNKNGGKYDFPLSQKDKLTKEFGDFAFSGKPGETKLVHVESQGYTGYHYIQVMKQGTPSTQSKIAFIAKGFTPSEETNQQLNTTATQFAIDAAANATAFEKAAQKAGAIKREAGGLNINSSTVNGLGASSELVRWAYEAKKGDVSPTFIIGGNYVVAKLTGITKKGEMDMNSQMRSGVEQEIMRMKKAAMLSKQYGKPASLATVATAAAQQVQRADSVTFMGSPNPAVGNEPKLLGYTFNKNLKQGMTSPAIQGQAGVYYMNLVSRTENAANVARNPEMEMKLAESALKSSAPNTLISSLMDEADVDDNRGTFYTK